MKKRDQTKGERVGSRVRDGHEGHRERAASAGRRAFLLRSAEQCVLSLSPRWSPEQHAQQVSLLSVLRRA